MLVIYRFFMLLPAGMYYNSLIVAFFASTVATRYKTGHFSFALAQSASFNSRAYYPLSTFLLLCTFFHNFLSRSVLYLALIFLNLNDRCDFCCFVCFISQTMRTCDITSLSFLYPSIYNRTHSFYKLVKPMNLMTITAKNLLAIKFRQMLLIAFSALNIVVRRIPLSSLVHVLTNFLQRILYILLIEMLKGVADYLW